MSEIISAFILHAALADVRLGSALYGIHRKSDRPTDQHRASGRLHDVPRESCPVSIDLAHMSIGDLDCAGLTETTRRLCLGNHAQFAAGAVGYGEGMCCCAAMTTRPAA